MNEILEDYSQLVKGIAHSACYSSSVIDVADLYQVGYLAVLRAIKAYDPSCGSNIRTFIAKAVRRDIYREAATFLGVFSVDRRVTNSASKVSKLYNDGYSDDEIVNILNSSGKYSFDVDDIKDLRLFYSRRQIRDFVFDEPMDCVTFEEESILDLVLSVSKSSIEETILRNRILGDESAQDVAHQLNIPIKRLYEIESELKARIKFTIEENII